MARGRLGLARTEPEPAVLDRPHLSRPDIASYAGRSFSRREDSLTMADLDQPLRLHPLTYLEEGDEVTVGRADINSFGLFPPDGAALLRQLEAGRPPNEAARWYSDQ